MTDTTKPEAPGGGAKLAIDLGPLLVFFGVNFATDDVIMATGAFMVAIIASMLISRAKFGHISPLLWFSGVMVVVMGGLTIWLHNETFIKMKPTIVNAIVAPNAQMLTRKSRSAGSSSAIARIVPIAITTTGVERCGCR